MSRSKHHPKSHKTVQPQPVRKKTTLAKEMNYFANQINRKKYEESAVSNNDNSYKPRIKNLKAAKSLVSGKRGTRVDAPAKCTYCGSYVSSHWRYRIEEGVYLYLCHPCKNKIKPSTIISTVTYNSIETNKRRH